MNLRQAKGASVPAGASQGLLPAGSAARTH
jgi:hypothetical protein